MAEIKNMNCQLRICFCVSDISACGGTERVCLKIADELCHRGHEIHIVSLTSKDEPFFDFDKRIVFHTLLPTRLDKKFIHKRWYKKWKLSRLLNRLKVDFVIDTTLSDIISSAVLKRSEKYISWIHFSHDYTSNYKPHVNTINQLKEKGGNMVVLTESDRQMYIEDILSSEKITVIHNPITFDTIPAPGKREKKVISVGRFAPEKGFDLLLKAWAIVEKEDNDWRLEIWGDDGRYDSNLYDLKDRLGLKRATLHGVTSDVGALMQQSSIYALSSRTESFGLVLLEASVCRLPLIAFDCPSGPRAIIKDGVNGMLVPGENVELLAEAILDLIKNDEKRERMGNVAFEMSKRFSLDEIADQWECLLNRI